MLAHTIEMIAAAQSDFVFMPAAYAAELGNRNGAALARFYVARQWPARPWLPRHL